MWATLIHFYCSHCTQNVAAGSGSLQRSFLFVQVDAEMGWGWQRLREAARITADPQVSLLLRTPPLRPKRHPSVLTHDGLYTTHRTGSVSLAV